MKYFGLFIISVLFVLHIAYSSTALEVMKDYNTNGWWDNELLDKADITSCDKIKNEYSQQKCYLTNYTQSDNVYGCKNLSDIKFINNESFKQSCLYYFLDEYATPQNFQSCSKLSELYVDNINAKDFCYSFTAFNTNDTKYCDFVLNSTVNDSCNNIVSERVQNKIEEDYKNRCIPNWSCSNWGPYVDGIRTRTCTDTKKCNTSEGYPTTSEKCVPNWSCSDWSVSNEVKTRNCVDLLSCNSTEDKPIIITYCEPKWSCSKLGACLAGVQRQACKDLNNCNLSTDIPPLTISCETTQEFTFGPIQEWTFENNQGWTISSIGSSGVNINDENEKNVLALLSCPNEGPAFAYIHLVLPENVTKLSFNTSGSWSIYIGQTFDSGLRVKITESNNPWSIIYEDCLAITNVNDWKYKEVNISSFAGKNVTLMFEQFGADCGTGTGDCNVEVRYIDNVRIE